MPEPVPDALPELPPENPVKAAVAAQAKGVVTPRREWFKGVTYAPPYHANNSYLVYVAEGEAVSVRFCPREIPSPVVCSDGGVILSTARTQSGAGATETWTLDIKARMRAEGATAEDADVPVAAHRRPRYRSVTKGRIYDDPDGSSAPGSWSARPRNR